MMYTIEDLGHGISRYWIDPGEIICIATEGDMSRSAVDTWTDACLESINGWPGEAPIFVLLDVSSEKQGFTPYSSRRTREIFNHIAYRTGSHVAVLLQNNFINQVIRLFVTGLMRGNNHIKIQFFTEREEAIRWLELAFAEFERRVK